MIDNRYFITQNLVMSQVHHKDCFSLVYQDIRFENQYMICQIWDEKL